MLILALTVNNQLAVHCGEEFATSECLAEQDDILKLTRNLP
jgi:hypothetical protein